MRSKSLLACSLALAAAGVTIGSAQQADWPMWGGTPSRNMVSDMKGLPTTWDVKTGKNIKWVAELGSQAYGNPTVGDGVVMVGTNNEALRDPNFPLRAAHELGGSSADVAFPPQYARAAWRNLR